MTLIHKPQHSGYVTGHWMDLEETPRRVRVVFGGETIADSNHVLLVREAMHIPSYCFPERDVRTDLMNNTILGDHHGLTTRADLIHDPQAT